MFKRLFGFLTGKSETTFVPNDVPPMQAVMGGGVEDAPQEAFSLTDTAQRVIGAGLSKQMVVRHGFNGEEKATFPVAGVKISAGHGREDFVLYDERQMLKGDTVRMSIRLSKPVTDYHLDSFNQAIGKVLASIPTLQGKVDMKAMHKPQHYADIWQELQSVLAAHPHVFSEKERAMIAQFFDANKGKLDQGEEWRGAVRAEHSEGKVSFDIKANELPADKNATISSDAEVVGYFKEHHDALLAKMKEHVLSLKKPDGAPLLTAEQLAHLDLHVQATGWGIIAEFGTKSATDVDPLTNQKLTDAELAKKMTETPLANVDTKELEALFTQSLLECSKELPPLLPRIMDGHMLADILRKRTHDAADVKAFIAKHDMFKNETQIKAEKEENNAKGIVQLQPVIVTQASDEMTDELSLDFSLPQGMDMEQFLSSIVGRKSQHALAVAPKTNLGVAA